MICYIIYMNCVYLVESYSAYYNSTIYDSISPSWVWVCIESRLDYLSHHSGIVHNKWLCEESKRVGLHTVILSQPLFLEFHYSNETRKRSVALKLLHGKLRSRSTLFYKIFRFPSDQIQGLGVDGWQANNVFPFNLFSIIVLFNIACLKIWGKNNSVKKTLQVSIIV